MSETHISRAGIVEGVKAKRKGSEVVSLAVSVRFDTMLIDEYAYGSSGETKVDEVQFHVPPNSGINPGDVVVINLDFKSPFGQRFVPALTVGDDNPADELDEDILADEEAIDVDA